MSDQAGSFQPGWEQVAVPFRPRSDFAGDMAFGSGDGAVLLDHGISRRLRAAAEFATQERRVAGGLLFGRGWLDEQGSYVVIDGLLEAGPGENRGDRLTADGPGEFTLSEASLRLLRADAARMYPASLEVGWWRTMAAPGEFGPRDFATQAELAGPDGVGLLVFGSGVPWGTAYLGEDGHAPDTAGTLALTTDAPLEPGPAPAPEPADAGPELVDISAGEHLAQEQIPLADPVKATRKPGLTDAGAGRPLREQAKRRPGRGQRRMLVPNPNAVEPRVPRDVQFVVGALAVAGVVAGIIVGALLHSLTAAVIIVVIVLLVLFGGVWVSRRM